MINKLRKIALGTLAIAAVIGLFTTGPEVAQVWSQAANAISLPPELAVKQAEIVNKAILLFGVQDRVLWSDLSQSRELSISILPGSI